MTHTEKTATQSSSLPPPPRQHSHNEGKSHKNGENRETNLNRCTPAAIDSDVSILSLKIDINREGCHAENHGRDGDMQIKQEGDQQQKNSLPSVQPALNSVNRALTECDDNSATREEVDNDDRSNEVINLKEDRYSSMKRENKHEKEKEVQAEEEKEGFPPSIPRPFTPLKSFLSQCEDNAKIREECDVDDGLSKLHCQLKLENHDEYDTDLKRAEKQNKDVEMESYEKLEGSLSDVQPSLTPLSPVSTQLDIKLEIQEEVESNDLLIDVCQENKEENVEKFDDGHQLSEVKQGVKAETHKEFDNTDWSGKINQLNQESIIKRVTFHSTRIIYGGMEEDKDKGEDTDEPFIPLTQCEEVEEEDTICCEDFHPTKGVSYDLSENKPPPSERISHIGHLTKKEDNYCPPASLTQNEDDGDILGEENHLKQDHIPKRVSFHINRIINRETEEDKDERENTGLPIIHLTQSEEVPEEDNILCSDPYSMKERTNESSELSKIKLPHSGDSLHINDSQSIQEENDYTPTFLTQTEESSEEEEEEDDEFLGSEEQKLRNLDRSGELGQMVGSQSVLSQELIPLMSKQLPADNYEGIKADITNAADSSIVESQHISSSSPMKKRKVETSTIGDDVLHKRVLTSSFDEPCGLFIDAAETLAQRDKQKQQRAKIAAMEPPNPTKKRLWNKIPHKEMETAQKAAELARSIINSKSIKKKILLAMALMRTNPRFPKPNPPNNTVIEEGFFWSNFPKLESILRSRMTDFYELSTMHKQTRKQQNFNNELVQIIKHEAEKEEWKFSSEMEDEKKIRDRIRCFFKTHIQNSKKRLDTMLKNPRKKANAKALINHRELIENCAADDEEFEEFASSGSLTPSPNKKSKYQPIINEEKQELKADKAQPKKKSTSPQKQEGKNEEVKKKRGKKNDASPSDVTYYVEDESDYLSDSTQEAAQQVMALSLGFDKLSQDTQVVKV